MRISRAPSAERGQIGREAAAPCSDRAALRRHPSPPPGANERGREGGREPTGAMPSTGGGGRVDGSCAMLLLSLLFLSLVPSEGASPRRPRQHQVPCSKSCVAENCHTVGIRYGKFCGVGWTGCPGEKPCDELDACCKVHDDCVGKGGLLSVECHEKFKRCIRKVKKSGKAGFSKECPYETAMPTMIHGMDLAILFSTLGNKNAEL